jgi:hypothetical protein
VRHETTPFLTSGMRSTKGSWTPTGSRSSRSRIAARFVPAAAIASSSSRSAFEKRISGAFAWERAAVTAACSAGTSSTSARIASLRPATSVRGAVGEVEVEAEVANQPREIGIRLDLQPERRRRGRRRGSDARAFGEDHTRGDS